MYNFGPQFSFDTLCAYHPAFALAIIMGIPVRPSERVIKAPFSSFALNQPISASFDQQITSYSVFAGLDISLDPTGAFTGNVFKQQSDFFQAWGASGITVTLLARTNSDNDYSPIPSDTPLQMLPRTLSRAAGIWYMASPDNIKAQFTLQSTPPGAPPLTVWLTFAFLSLAPQGQDYLNIPAPKARAMLNKILYDMMQGKPPPPPWGVNAPPSP